MLLEPVACHIPAVLNAPLRRPTAETVKWPPMTLGRRDAHDGKDASDESRASSNNMKSFFSKQAGECDDDRESDGASYSE